MKEHEQQTSRLEKISDFFEVNNFSKLNLYNICLATFFIFAVALTTAADQLKIHEQKEFPIMKGFQTAGKVMKYSELDQKSWMSLIDNPESVKLFPDSVLV